MLGACFDMSAEIAGSKGFPPGAVSAERWRGRHRCTERVAGQVEAKQSSSEAGQLADLPSPLPFLRLLSVFSFGCKQIYKCREASCPRPACYKSYPSSKEDDPPCEVAGCKGTMELLRHVSFIGASLASLLQLSEQDRWEHGSEGLFVLRVCCRAIAVAVCWGRRAGYRGRRWETFEQKQRSTSALSLGWPVAAARVGEIRARASGRLEDGRGPAFRSCGFRC